MEKEKEIVSESKTDTTVSPESEPKGKEIPIDIFSDKIPEKEVLPLDGQVKTKEYASLPNQQAEPPAGTIPPAQPGATGAPATATAPPNPEEVKNQAEQTVDLMLKGYEKLHALGRYLGKIDQSELTSMHAKGTIDLHLELPIGNNNIKVQQFFNEYNTELDKNISVSDDFKKNITPPLTRICIKHNWLLSDELYVGSIVAEDLTTKVSLLIGLKKSANMILAACMDIQKKKEERAKEEKPPANPANQDNNTTTHIPNDPNDTWKEPQE